MPWSGSDFQRNQNFSADASAGINILASRVDDEFNNFETGLEGCLKTDGTNAAAADFAMGGYKHTNVGAAVSINQYIRLDQVQQLTPIYAAFAGTAEAISASTNPTFAAMVTGHTIIVSCPSANAAGTSVTLAVNGLSADPVRRPDNTVISPGDVKGLHEYSWRGGYWALMNPPVKSSVTALLDYEASTFMAYLTGVETTVSATAKFVLNGNVVTISLPSLEATSNATDCLVMGSPAQLRPTAAMGNQYFPIQVVNSSSANWNGLAMVKNASAGIKLFVNGSADGFVAAGQKGVFGRTTIVYILS